jgi:hypothetical protein
MDRDVEALNAEILTETDRLAQAYAERFAGDPMGELQAWLHIAARREAMVSQVYGISERSYRLPEPRLPPGAVAWEALTLIWQHEAVHTRFIQVRLEDGTLRVPGVAPALMTWLGQTEGRFLGALTSRPGLRRAFSYFAVRLGALLTPDKVPEFTRDLAQLETREFFLLCGALETTARQSYARMEELTKTLSDAAARGGRINLQFDNLITELHRIMLDETFHEQAFREMSGWLLGSNFDPALTDRACAERLAQLLPRSEQRGGDDEGIHYVMTDGGLGPLFKDKVSIVVR